MRIWLSSLAVALLVLSYGAFVSAQSGVQHTFTTNLSLGSKGMQILLLQQFLNRDPDTRIASTGPGSPGQETSYFGMLTKAAVVRFQQKYAQEVLAPVGLFQGNGYVGVYTRAKLNALSALTASTAPSISAIPTTSTGSSQATALQNPNLKNLDGFLAALESVAIKQGSSASGIATMKEQVMKVVATTTDLQAVFEKMVQSQSNQTIRDDSFLGRTLATMEKALETVFLPERANAAVPVVPFGGALLSAFPCKCSGTWIIYISPLPPSYATVLTYVLGSQAFLSYNIPYTSWLLGSYAPGAGVCLVPATPCYPLPSWGKITPMVGSSPL